jgi:hypothetical protein
MTESNTQREPAQEWGSPSPIDARDIPIRTFTDWDSVTAIRSVLRSLEAGQFLSAAMLADGMLRDDRINAVLATRVGGLLGSPIAFESDDSRDGKKMARALRGDGAAPSLWDQMFTASTISELLRWGLLLNMGVGELIWSTEGGQWVPRLKVWHPQFVMWRWDTWSYWVQTMDGMVELPKVDQEIHSDGKWIVYCPFGFRFGWLRGLLRALAQPYLIRNWAYRDWARYSEVHGLPARKAVVPSSAEDFQKRQFVSSIANLGNEPVIECQVRSDGQKFDLELVEANAQSHEGFKQLIEKCESSIAIALLGHNLTTEVKGGSLAAARVGDDIRDDIRRWDALTIPRTLRDQALVWWARYNFGSEAKCPHPRYQVDPVKDADSSANRLKTVASAIETLRKVEAPVDYVALCKAHDVPLVDDAAWEPMEKPAPVAPFGAKPGAEDEPPAEEKPADEKKDADADQ